MATSYASVVVPASAEETWDLVRDFDGLPRWHPSIQVSTIEDGGRAAEVGCVRRLTLADGGVVRERLCALDDESRCCSYCFVESPFPVRSYLATLRVRPVTDNGHAFVEWFAQYDCESADQASLDVTFGEGVFGTGLRQLARRFSG